MMERLRGTLLGHVVHFPVPHKGWCIGWVNAWIDSPPGIKDRYLLCIAPHKMNDHGFEFWHTPINCKPFTDKDKMYEVGVAIVDYMIVVQSLERVLGRDLLPDEYPDPSDVPTATTHMGMIL